MSKCLLNSRRLDAVTTSLGKFTISNQPIEKNPFLIPSLTFPRHSSILFPERRYQDLSLVRKMYAFLSFSLGWTNQVTSAAPHVSPSRIFENFIQILTVCHSNILMFRTEHSIWSKVIPVQLYQSFSMACQNFPEVTSWYKFTSQYFPHALLIWVTVLCY